VHQRGGCFGVRPGASTSPLHDGITNAGNTCLINSTLVAFFAAVGLHTLSITPTIECRAPSFSGRACQFCHLSALICEVARIISTGSTPSSDVMRRFRYALWCNPLGHVFGRGGQEDAHELPVSYIQPALEQIDMKPLNGGLSRRLHILVLTCAPPASRLACFS